jgi:lipid-binding SYLF domain-containing protein
MAESVASTDLGEEGLQTAGNSIVCNPHFFFTYNPVTPPSIRARGKRSHGADVRPDLLCALKGKSMKKIIGIFCAVAIAASTLSAVAQDDRDQKRLNERLASAALVIREVMATPDRAIPQSILAGAHCVVVVPKYKKGAFGFGGQYGQGVATCRTGHGWSAPVFVRLEGGSFGFQIGGQSTDLVLVAMNDHGMEHMLASKVKLGGDAAATAGPVGRNAQASTDASLHAEFLTYSRSQGLFAGIDLDGTVLSQNADDTRTEYGANISYNAVLHGDVPAQPNAVNFVHTVARYFIVSRDNH